MYLIINHISEYGLFYSNIYIADVDTFFCNIIKEILVVNRDFSCDLVALILSIKYSMFQSLIFNNIQQHMDNSRSLKCLHGELSWLHIWEHVRETFTTRS